MRKITFAILSALIINSCSCNLFNKKNQPKQIINTSQIISPTIPIVAWVGIPADFISNERFHEMKEAGFTTSFGEYPENTVQTALELAKNNNLKLILSQPVEHTPDIAAANELRISFINRWKNNAALSGWFLVDEPKMDAFPSIAQLKSSIKQADPFRLCFINLFGYDAWPSLLGASDYEEYLDNFISTVNPDLLSFDLYPIADWQTHNPNSNNLTINPVWYKNLELIRNKAIEKNILFWAFILSNHHLFFPAPTKGQMLLQANSNLAYGARGLEYFTYWTPEDTNFASDSGMISRDGNKTIRYQLVEEVNSKLSKILPILAETNIVKIEHLSANPDGTTLFSPDETILEVTGTDAIISTGNYQNKKILMIVNKKFNADNNIKIKFAGKASLFNYSSKISEDVPQILEFTMEPGGAELILIE